MKGIRKTTFREIRSSFGRFLAMFAIVALGVGFFAGLKVARQAMVATVTEYLEEHVFYDLRLLSTMGFDRDSVDFFASAGGAEAAEGAVSFDMLYSLADGNQGVIKAYSMPERVNTLKLTAGRMPEQSDECLADSGHFKESDLGGSLYLSGDNAEEDLERFTYREYRIVGLVQSPLYLQYERGNTSLGDGRLDGYVYLEPEGFAVDYFTEIYVRFGQRFGLYSEEYEAFTEEQEPVWEAYAEEAALARHGRILEEAREEIEKAREELEEKRTEGEAELADAAGELEDAWKELEDGQKALEDAREELEEGERTLQTKREELEEARATLAQKETELTEGEAELAEKEAELALSRAEIDGREASLRGGGQQLAAEKVQLEEGEAAAAAARQTVSEKRAALEKRLEELKSGGDSPLAAAAVREIESSLQLLDKTEEQMSGQEQELAAARAKLEESERQLAAGLAALEAGRQQLAEGEKTLSEAKQELTAGRSALEEAKRKLEDGEAEIGDAAEELQKAQATLSEKEAELADGLSEYADGEKEYEEGRQEFDEKIADAEGEIADAEAELADLAEPEVYVLGRDTNVGYVCFDNDSGIIEGIANIFPIFFFLVAALVCITTMNRMVEEQRTLIGVLKALGYGEWAIMSKYMVYSGLAALSGCIFGFFFGTWGFPRVIWACYDIMYDADPIFYVFDWRLALVSLAVSFLCSIGTTWLSCRVELGQVAAALMRPKAPKAGKRVLLEYIPFLWRRLGFLRKVSIRNIFRYKKRLFMMVVGISGCTALLVTGFGVRDSIADVGTRQFQEIQTYDLALTLKEDAGESIHRRLDDMEAVEAYTCAMEKNMDLLTEKGVKSVYLVAGTAQGMAPFLNLHGADGVQVGYPSAGEAVVSNKLAEEYGVEAGGMITLRDEGMRTLSLRVAAVYENYIYNYVHISEDTWREQMGEEPERRTIYLNRKEGPAEGGPIRSDILSVHELSAELMKLDQVANVTVSADVMERLGNMLSSLNIIVVVVIFCAAGLAFVVLYNLTNINITERIREIATIKVLGFYRRETAAYVFRENVMLTALGMGLGLWLGKLLHWLVMNEIKVDMIAFDIYVRPASFAYSGLLTLIFAWLVNLAMSGKLDAVSMTESLKSVD